MTRPRLSTVVVDVRALQSAASADRGIGRYTLDLFVTLEARHPDLVTFYAYDPALPIHANLRSLEPSGKLRANDHPDVARTGHAVFHIASVWEITSVEQLLPAWVEPGLTAVVATVFDVIPMLFPEVYLTDRRVTAGYTVRAAALRTMDRLVTISDTTADDVVRTLGVPAERVIPIYGGVAPFFTAPTESVTSVRAQLPATFASFAGIDYTLAPLGMEPRKNMRRLIQAFSRLDETLREAHPLVIQCAAGPPEIAEHQQLADELRCGGQVYFTGYVDDADLVRLYQGAHLVVFPSIYEGLGLPVLEARRCGAPVICGDNSALREIMVDPRARFDALDVDAITTSIDRVLRDEGLRNELASLPVPPQFDWHAAADSLAEVYLGLMVRPVRRRHTRRPRLAISSPAPPHYSGPAVYMGLLLQELVELCDVTLLTPDEPAGIQVDDRVSVERLADLQVLELVDGPFDEVLYVLGNSEFHISQAFFHRRRPGSILLHDARLVGMYRQMAEWGPHLLPDPTGLVPTLRRMYPDRYDASLTSLEWLTNEDVERLGILMVADVARSARRLLVHSTHAADMVERDCGRRPEVAFGHPFPVLEHRGEVEPGLVVSFGVLSPAKGTGLIVDAMAQLDPSAHLALVGHVDDPYRSELTTHIAARGLQDRVTVTGSVGRDEYLGWLGRAEVAVQLRMATNGESSGALAETLAAGVPTIVSDSGTFRDLPEGLVVQLPTRSGPSEIAAAVSSILGSPAARERMSDAGRSHASANSYAEAARRLVDTLFGG